MDKLDDLFRLDIIDESTKVWRPGMAEWQSLGVLAGIEPDSQEPTRVQNPPEASRPAPAVEAAPRSVPAPASRSMPAPSSRPVPTPAPRSMSAPAPRSVPTPAPRSVPAPSSRPVPTPAPRTVDNDAPTPVITDMSSTVPFWAMNDASAMTRTATLDPPPVSAVMRPGPSESSPSPVEAMLLREMGVAAPSAPSTGRAQRLLLALSVVAGLAVTLYRNDVLRDAARSAGREGVYQQIESALGGPGFGTPRALEKLGVSR